MTRDGSTTPTLSRKAAPANVAGRSPAPDSRDRIRDPLVSLADQAVVSSTNFLTRLSVGYLCAPEAFGLLVLVFTLLMLWEGIRNSFLASPIAVFLPRKTGQDIGPYIGSTLILQGILLVAGALFLAASSGICHLAGEPRLPAALLVGIIALCGWSSREHVRCLHYARLRVWPALWTDAGCCLAQVGCLAALYFTGRFNVLAVLAVIGVCQGAGALAGVALLRKEITFRKVNLSGMLAPHWKFGRWILAGTAVYIVASEVYPWLLKGTHGLEAVAALGACQLPLFFARPLVLGLNNILTPRMSHDYAAGGIASLKASVRRAQIMLLVPLSMLAVAMAIFSGDILGLLFKGNYIEYSGILSLLTVQLIVLAVVTPINQAFLVLDRPHYHFYITAAGALCTLCAGLYLTCTLGVTGAGYGLVIVISATGMLSLFLFEAVASGSTKKAPHILYLNLGTYSGLGGIENFNKSFVTACAEYSAVRSGRVTVLSLWDDPKGASETFEGAPVVYHGCGRSKIRFMLKLVRLGLWGKADAVIAGHVLLAPLLLAINLVRPAIRRAIVAYGIEVWERPGPWARLALRRAHKVITVSQFTARKIAEVQDFPSEKIDVVYCPARIDDRETLEEVDLPGRYNLLSVSRLSADEKIKGQDRAIRSMPEILSRIPDTHYLIAGEGDDLPRLKGLVASLGLGKNVHFLGRVSEGEKNYLMKACDVFLMPSRGEGFGIVFIESMIRGTPVVAGNRDASREVVADGETGKVVDPESPSEIADAVVDLLSDEAERTRMGEAGIERVRSRFLYRHYRDRVRSALEDLTRGDREEVARG